MQTAAWLTVNLLSGFWRCTHTSLLPLSSSRLNPLFTFSRIHHKCLRHFQPVSLIFSFHFQQLCLSVCLPASYRSMHISVCICMHFHFHGVRNDFMCNAVLSVVVVLLSVHFSLSLFNRTPYLSHSPAFHHFSFSARLPCVTLQRLFPALCFGGMHLEVCMSARSRVLFKFVSIFVKLFNFLLVMLLFSDLYYH